MHKDVCCIFGVDSYGKNIELQMKREIKRAIEDGYRFFSYGIIEQSRHNRSKNRVRREKRK